MPYVNRVLEGNYLWLDEDQPTVLVQDDLATDMGRFCIALVIRMSRSCSWITFVPGMFAGFVNVSADDGSMNTLKRLNDDWELCKGMTGKFWTRYLQRSPFNRVGTAQILEVAKQIYLRTSEQLRQLITGHWSKIKNTKVVEDFVREDRIAGE